jgi:GMP synthase-like glutamine amidotransferase
MKPVLVIEHSEGDGPGHFGEWLAARGRPMALVQVHAGDTVPVDLQGYAGLCVLGGPMSANDEHLDHIRAELALMRLALERGLPVIGHCLGGQLLARALGGSVGPSPALEIGWHQVNATDTAAAQLTARAQLRRYPCRPRCLFSLTLQAFCCRLSVWVVRHLPRLPRGVALVAMVRWRVRWQRGGVRP